MNPSRDGLAATRTYKGKSGDEMLLLLGLEAATNAVWKGREVSPEAYCTYRAVIQRAQGLERALDARIKQMGGEDD